MALEPQREILAKTSIKHKMLGIEPRLAFINGVLLANRFLIFRFQLLAVYVLLVHNCSECRISDKWRPKSMTFGIEVWQLQLLSRCDSWATVRVENNGLTAHD
jgi:hypothetical protein